MIQREFEIQCKALMGMILPEQRKQTEAHSLFHDATFYHDLSKSTYDAKLKSRRIKTIWK